MMTEDDNERGPKMLKRWAILFKASMGIITILSNWFGCGFVQICVLSVLFLERR